MRLFSVTLLVQLIFSTAYAVEFSEIALKSHLKKVTSYPHPMGSDKQRETAKFISSHLKKFGYELELQSFKTETPNTPYPPYTKTVEAINVLAYTKHKAKCYNVIASHYDTKILDNFTGANDPGSSIAGLLELAGKLKNKTSKAGCNFLIVFFDGEEATLEGWNDSQRYHPSRIIDNTYGSRYMASTLVKCKKEKYCDPYRNKPIENLIILDMIGAPNLKLSLDMNSSQRLLNKAKQLDLKYFDGSLYRNSYMASIADDHIPFCKLGIPCLNIIDFNHLDHWHNSTDTAENIDFQSIKKATQLAYYLSLDL